MRTAIFALLCSALAFGADAPRVSPAFTINRPGAAPLQLSQYRGKVVAVAFILTTCPHCQALTKTLLPIAKDYASKGVQFLECAFNAGAEGLVPQFVEQFQPPFPVGWSSDAAVRNYLQYTPTDTRTLYVPHMVFLDRQGRIRGDYAAESSFFQSADASIRAELDKLLKLPTATAANGKK